jgi:hypothetical protein
MRKHSEKCSLKWDLVDENHAFEVVNHWKEFAKDKTLIDLRVRRIFPSVSMCRFAFALKAPSDHHGEQAVRSPEFAADTPNAFASRQPRLPAFAVLLRGTSTYAKAPT